MRLTELLAYENIVIQCHDNPDPDTVGAGYALYSYFRSHGIAVRLVYSGHLSITKPNMMMMIEHLKIPIEYIHESRVKGLLITVDCQYGAGNVTRIEADEVAIIDHHIQEVPIIRYQDVRSELASTSTLVWELLSQAEYDVNGDIHVSTALYYGLFTDSSAFSEVHHPLDKDMRDILRYDTDLIRRLKNTIITLRELEIAGMALIRNSYNAANKSVVVKAQECDPNILGLISDFALQVDCVNVTIVYNEASEGIKYSVRSCVKEVMANELAAFLSQGIGNGGGHRSRGAGFISRHKYNEQYSQLNADEYFLRRLTEYYQSFDIIDSREIDLEDERFKLYKKIPTPMGYVKLSTILPCETVCILRNKKADTEIGIKEDTMLLIDQQGMTYLIDEGSFNMSYQQSQRHFEPVVDYFPKIYIPENKRLVYLESYVKPCVAKGEAIINARELEKNVKIFSEQNQEFYKVGRLGDYLVREEKGDHNLQLIKKEVFQLSYLPLV